MEKLGAGGAWRIAIPTVQNNRVSIAIPTVRNNRVTPILQSPLPIFLRPHQIRASSALVHELSHLISETNSARDGSSFVCRVAASSLLGGRLLGKGIVEASHVVEQLFHDSPQPGCVALVLIHPMKYAEILLILAEKSSFYLHSDVGAFGGDVLVLVEMEDVG